MLPDYAVLSLPVLTLPPADSINTVIMGIDPVWIVDPGSEEHSAILRHVAGRNVGGIVLTHRHRDHVSGANALREGLRCQVYAHPITADELKDRVPVDVLLAEGAFLPLGEGRQTRVLHTPGHARGHIVLHEVETGVMVVGDMVAGLGSIVIAAPDGNVRDYLASLTRMVRLSPRVLIPAHGPLIENAVAKLDEYIAHRLKRQAEILQAVRQGATTLDAVVAVVYAGTPAVILPWAERSAATHLDKLVEDGVVVRDGGAFISAS